MLQRFVEAQDNCYSQVLIELRNGKKQSHWMWFVFPQIVGLGCSPTAEYYAIKNIDEAKAYLAHDILGARLRECTGILIDHDNLSASELFGYPDDMKFCSSMTLFDQIVTNTSLFNDAIDKFCAGHRDARTLAIIR